MVELINFSLDEHNYYKNYKYNFRFYINNLQGNIEISSPKKINFEDNSVLKTILENLIKELE